MIPVYRVQHPVDGRGPWRPGWSQFWIDGDAPAGRLTETVFDLYPAVATLSRDLHYGSACRTLGSLLQWFTPIEQQRLARLGFYPTRLLVDRVIAESPWQLLVGRVRPFAEGATRLRWPS